MRKLLLFYFFSLYSFSNINNFGNLGYINTPNAYNLGEGVYSFNLIRNQPDRKLNFTLSPFNWIDASIFYVDITDKPYGGGFEQSYKDKGFNVKLSPFTLWGHKMAFGLNDLAGTGLFSSEYIVFSNSNNKFEYSFGMAWGVFDDGITIKNPLRSISKNFNERSNVLKDKGGNFDFKNYFSGEKSSIFFGTNYRINKNTSILFELDPTNTNNSGVPYEKKNSKFNFGVNHKYRNFSIKYFFQRGSNVGIQLSYFEDTKKYYPFITKPPYKKDINFSNLQKVLEKNNIGLKKISQKKDSLRVAVRQLNYFDHKEADKFIIAASKNLGKYENFKEIIVDQYYQGMKVASSVYDEDDNQYLVNDDWNENQYESLYLVNESYPYFRSHNYLTLRNYIAGREQFLISGLLLQNDIQFIFQENLFFLSNLKYSLWDNYDQLIYPPVDTYPEQVRSDNKEYLKEISNGISLGRFELNYFFSPIKNHYFRSSFGIFEEMYGGIGIDYVYSKEHSVLSYGLEAYHLKKRDYDLDLNFFDYENNIIRGAIQIQDPRSDTRYKLSFGEYIAGDVGYTFEAKKVFTNGVEFGAFFSRTNVSKKLYGEGSFDKGVTIRIPLSNLFSGKKTLNQLEWRPLTKDPAALLIKSVDLFDEVNRFRFY